MKFTLIAVFLVVAVSANPVARPQVSRTKNCPAGYELTGKRCEATEVVPPNYVCPAGTTLVDGQCSTFNRATRQCPSGFHLNGKSCVATETSPALFQCSTGEIDESGRGCRQTKAVAPTCPAGFVQQSKQCVRYSPQQKQCPAGYTSQGKDCARTLTFPAEPTCPASYSLAGEKACVREVPIPPRCEAGYTMEGYECIVSLAKVPSPCPKGFSAVANSCIQPLQFPTRPVCPSDFDLVGENQCIKSIPIPPSCPAGTRRGSSGQCETPVPLESVCEDGFQLVRTGKNAICSLTLNFPTAPRCAAGYTLIHGQCKKATAQQPIQRCSQGVLQNGYCSSQTTSTPSIGCPEGFRLTKGPSCVQDVSYDCSQTTTRTECEMPAFVAEVLAAPASSKSARFLKAAVKSKEVPVLSKQPVPVASKEPVCRQVPQVVPRTCTKTEKAPLRHFCADGSEAQGKQCVQKIATAAEVHCAVGRFDQQTGQCVTISIVPAEQVCPSGSVKQGKSCVQIETREVQKVCPAGSQPAYAKKGSTSCVVVKEELVHPARVIQQAPQAVCDVGTRQGNVCVDKEVVPRGTECPPKTEDRKGRCIKTSALIAPPPRQEQVPARFVCADGKPASGKSCAARESVPIQHFCQSGQPEGNRCVHSAELIYPPALVIRTAAAPVCQKGYTLQGDKCLTTVSQPVQKVCPAGFYEYQDGARECVKNHPQVSVCPAGTTQSKSGCTKKLFAQPQVIEIKECTKGQAGC